MQMPHWSAQLWIFITCKTYTLYLHSSLQEWENGMNKQHRKKTANEKSKNRCRIIKIAILVEHGMKPNPSHSNNNDKFIEFAKKKRRRETASSKIRQRPLVRMRFSIWITFCIIRYSTALTLCYAPLKFLLSSLFVLFQRFSTTFWL